MSQKYGYQSLHKPGAPRKSLPYELYKNQVGQVTKVTPFAYGHNLELVLDSTHEKVIAEAYGDTVRGLGPVDDLEKARTKYKGKTLWTKEIPNTYNEELDEEGVSILPKYIPVKVR